MMLFLSSLFVALLLYISVLNQTIHYNYYFIILSFRDAEEKRTIIYTYNFCYLSFLMYHFWFS